MKLMLNKKYLQQNFSRKVFAHDSSTNFMLMVSKSYVPLTCKFTLVCILCWFFF